MGLSKLLPPVIPGQSSFTTTYLRQKEQACLFKTAGFSASLDFFFQNSSSSCRSLYVAIFAGFRRFWPLKEARWSMLRVLQGRLLAGSAAPPDAAWFNAWRFSRAAGWADLPASAVSSATTNRRAPRAKPACPVAAWWPFLRRLANTYRFLLALPVIGAAGASSNTIRP